MRLRPAFTSVVTTQIEKIR